MSWQIYKAEDRGKSELGWLYSRHSFSFNEFYDINRMGFGALRVLNDDWVEPGEGFGTHGHANMEIVSMVLQGGLEHQDSMGNGGIIPAGEVQRMTAGTGITHSEFNASKKDPVHFLQIWIYPNKLFLKPSYQQKQCSTLMQKNKLVPIVSGDSEEDLIYIHQDARFYRGYLDPKIAVTHPINDSEKGVYLFVINGKIQVEENVLKSGDAIAFREMKAITVQAIEPSDILLIEVPLSGFR